MRSIAVPASPVLDGDQVLLPLDALALENPPLWIVSDGRYAAVRIRTRLDEPGDSRTYVLETTTTLSKAAAV